MPQASERPTFGLFMAGPADTGPFMPSVTGAITGPCAMAHPPSNTTQHKVTIRLFIKGPPPILLASFVPLVVDAAHTSNPNASGGGAGERPSIHPDAGDAGQQPFHRDGRVYEEKTDGWRMQGRPDRPAGEPQRRGPYATLPRTGRRRRQPLSSDADHRQRGRDLSTSSSAPATTASRPGAAFQAHDPAKSRRARNESRTHLRHSGHRRWCQSRPSYSSRRDDGLGR